ncbi:MAG TPA: mechanosensitive ion channel family protein [Burkholderiales bacterium]|nr:mechanosensitive ion channel family protein [Burkholderiales bacterium]
MDSPYLERVLQTLGIEEVPAWVHVLVALWNVILVLLLAWVLLRVLRRLLQAFHQRLMANAENQEERKRLETLNRVFRYIVSVLISIIAVMLVLSELGISIAPILATAGVAGIAIGFGAQSLVKDYFTGFVMLIENQVRQGDVVEIAGKGGLVEEVTLRYIRLRDYEGSVHYVPNSAISTVTNRSRDFAFSVIDLGVAYKENVEQVFDVMREVAKDMRSDPEIGPRILDDLEIAGVDKWADSSIMIRCRFRVRALEQWGVRREYLRRLKQAFDAHGIEIPFPHLTLYAGQDPKAAPLPLRLTGGDGAMPGQ